MNDLRQRIEHGFEALGRAIYRHHWKTLILVFALVAVMVSQIPKLTLDTSTEGFLHKEDPALLAYNGFRDQFGRDEFVVVAVTAPQIFAPEFLQKLKALHQELEENVPHLDDITSLINARDTRGAEGELIVEDLLEHWPEQPDEIAAIRDRALANPVYRNLLLSEDGSITTIVIRTDAYSREGATDDVLAAFDEGLEITAEPAVPAERKYLTDAENSELARAIQKIAGGYDSPDFRVHVAGSPVVSDVLKTAMQENMRRFMGMALLLIAAILALLFRRISGVILPLTVVVLSLLSTFGLMGAIGIAVKLPTQILPSFLLAVGVGASVHLLSIFYRRLQHSHDKQEAIAYSLGHSGLAIVMTSLTTAAGLASFAGAEVAPISDLGIVASSGVMIALVYTIVLLPALLSVTPIKPKTSDRAHSRHARMDTLLTAVATVSTRRRKLILTISAAVLAFGLAGISQVKFSHKPFDWLPTTNPARQASDFIDQNMRGASSVEVVVDTGQENGLYQPAIMQGLEQLSREVETLAAGPTAVGKSLSVADILKEIHKALNENREEFYHIPDNRELIAQEFLLFENSGSDDLEDFVDSQFRQARFTAKMPWTDAIYLPAFIDELKGHFQQSLGDDVELTVTGMNALLGRTMSAAIHSMSWSYVYAGVVITVMMVLLMGDLRIGLISMIPNLTPIILIVGLMGWFGIPLDLFTLLIGSIAIGLAVDDTIHFMHNYRRYHRATGDVDYAVRETLLGSGRAMLVTTLVLSIGFFIYIFSTLTNVINFGLLTGSAIILALLADFFLAPALMAQLHASHVIPDEGDY